MRYLPKSPADREAILKTMGARSIADLFASIPAEYRLERDLKVPRQMAESEIVDWFRERSRENGDSYAMFLGAGAYYHYRPVIIDSLISRGEFLTAYTPYQPEISQGTLQSIFEFQTMICQLTGLDVANASLYDGSTALAEALLMAERVQGRRRFAFSSLIHPQYRAVVDTYTRNLNYRIDSLPHAAGLTDLDVAGKTLTDETAALVVQYPNFLGNVEDLEKAAQLAHRHKTMLVVVVNEAVALGLLQPPGACCADICVG